MVVLDTDKRNCVEFLACVPIPNTLFRLAIEEIEAWYLGDQEALLTAYPDAMSLISRIPRLSRRRAAMPDESIDYSDTPPLTYEFWANASRGLVLILTRSWRSPMGVSS